MVVGVVAVVGILYIVLAGRKEKEVLTEETVIEEGEEKPRVPTPKVETDLTEMRHRSLAVGKAKDSRNKLHRESSQIQLQGTSTQSRGPREDSVPMDRECERNLGPQIDRSKRPRAGTRNLVHQR